jgi:dCTP diphosphatase
MHDNTTTIEQLKNAMRQFVDEREWNQFHSPKNLSMNIAVEAAELMEHFLWQDAQPFVQEDTQRASNIKEELADVLIGVLCFANACSIDLATAVAKKLEATQKKYPVDLCKGKSDKYTAYLRYKEQK